MRPQIKGSLDVDVVYRALPGYTLAATLLVRRIEYCFQVPVRLMEVDGGDMGVRVEGRIVYH